MADAEGESVENAANNHEKPVENGTNDIQTLEIKGWLMKRTKISHKWIKTWFLLTNTELCYGKSAEDTPKRIPLVGAEMAECSIDNKQFAFRIKPQNSKRIFYIHAEDEDSLHNWMQAICFAKAAGRTGGQSEACVIQ